MSRISEDFLHQPSLSSTPYTHATEEAKGKQDVVNNNFNCDRKISVYSSGFITGNSPSAPSSFKENTACNSGRSVYKSHKQRLVSLCKTSDHLSPSPLRQNHKRPMSYIPEREILRNSPSRHVFVNRNHRYSPLSNICPSRNQLVSNLKTNSKCSKGFVPRECDFYDNKALLNDKSSNDIRQLVLASEFKVLKPDNNCSFQTSKKSKILRKKFTKTPYKKPKKYNVQTTDYHSVTNPCKKNSAASEAIHDISCISSMTKCSFREQPSNLNMKQTMCDESRAHFPLHSTMNYPLHSTMKNGNLSLNISNLGSENECDSTEQLFHTISKPVSYCKTDEAGSSLEQQSTSCSSSGVSSNNDETLEPTNTFPLTSDMKENKLSFDEGINSSNIEDSVVGKRLTALLKTEASSVKDAYTLLYASKKTSYSSATNSVFSFDVDEVNNVPLKNTNNNYYQTHNPSINQTLKWRGNVNMLHNSSLQCHQPLQSDDAIITVSGLKPCEINTPINTRPTLKEFPGVDPHVNIRPTLIDFPAVNDWDSDESLDNSQVSTTVVIKMPHAKGIPKTAMAVAKGKECAASKSTHTEKSSYSLNNLRESTKSRKNILNVREFKNCLHIKNSLNISDNASKSINLRNRDIFTVQQETTTIINPNASMITQGCIQGLLRKKKAKSTKSKAQLKSSKQLLKTKKLTNSLPKDLLIDSNNARNDDENKENKGRLSNAQGREASGSNAVKSRVSSYCSLLLNEGYSSHQYKNDTNGLNKGTKKRLMKKMKDFHDSTFNNPRRMFEQTLGAI